MWRKESPCALLAGMNEIGAATVENGMKFPQKIKIRNTIMIQQSHF